MPIQSQKKNTTVKFRVSIIEQQQSEIESVSLIGIVMLQIFHSSKRFVISKVLSYGGQGYIHSIRISSIGHIRRLKEWEDGRRQFSKNSMIPYVR